MNKLEAKKAVIIKMIANLFCMFTIIASLLWATSIGHAMWTIFMGIAITGIVHAYFDEE